MDFYEENDAYWQIQLAFKNLFALREKCAELMDVSRDVLLPNDSILVLARQQPKTIDEFLKVIDEFKVAGSIEELGCMIVKVIADSIEQYPHEKAKLLRDSTRKGQKKASNNNDALEREKVKEQKRAAQVNKVKYDLCSALDQNG